MTSTFSTPYHKKVDSNTLMITFDVPNLYSNISYELGKQAITFRIEKYPEILYPRFNKKLMTDSIELILNNKLHPTPKNSYGN